LRFDVHPNEKDLRALAPSAPNRETGDFRHFDGDHRLNWSSNAPEISTLPWIYRKKEATVGENDGPND
jgi:hypothetical protein